VRLGCKSMVAVKALPSYLYTSRGPSDGSSGHPSHVNSLSSTHSLPIFTELSPGRVHLRIPFGLTASYTVLNFFWQSTEPSASSLVNLPSTRQVPHVGVGRLWRSTNPAVARLNSLDYLITIANSQMFR
jgi:hypothetical protein